MGRYSKFWASLAGPLVVGLTSFTQMDMDAAQSLVSAGAALVGSIAVLAGPANK